jgi:hypothetical protein
MGSSLDASVLEFGVFDKALVQTFGINAKRWGTLRGSCGENSIPDFWRPVVFDAKLSEFELTFPDPMHEFNASDGDRGALKAALVQELNSGFVSPLASYFT